MGSEDRINPTAKGGPASPLIPGTDGAQAGGGPHAGAAEGNVKGVLGMGSSAVGHPSGGMGGTADDAPLPSVDAERAQDIVEERKLSVLGGDPEAAPANPRGAGKRDG